MGSILGQIAFDGSAVDTDHFQVAIARDPSRAAPRTVHQTQKVRIAVSDDHAVGGAAGGIVTALDGALPADQSGEPEPARLAALWRRLGPDLPNEIWSDYALALYDGQSRQALLVRDHIGTRPLHWHWDGRRLSFSTFLPALLALLSETPGPDRQSVADFLRYPGELGGRTFFKGVRTLRPGRAVVVDTQGPKILRWWHPEDVAPVRYPDWRDYGAAANELVERAVEARLPQGDVAVGAHLSGGIDSSLVTLVAQSALAARGRSLTGGYSWSPPISEDDPEMEGDERLRIAAIAAEAGIAARFCAKPDTAYDIFRYRPFEFEGLADVLDEFSVLKQAEADGAGLLLTGWGGDEALSAHAHSVPAAVLRRGRVGQTLTLVRQRNQGFRPLSRSMNILWRQALLPLLPDVIYRRIGYFYDYFGQGCHIGEALADMPLDDRSFRHYRITGDPVGDIGRHLERGHVGERMATWAAWAAPYGIEYRYPLTDRRLLEFVLGVPAEVLWGDSRPRYLARAAIKGRTRTPLGKSDPANERHRARVTESYWDVLAVDLHAGRFDGACDWLDMESLRMAIRCGPSGDLTTDTRTLIRLEPAVRAWHMAQRFGVTGPEPTSSDE